MEAKLESITKRIPWSLLLKATALAVLWSFAHVSQSLAVFSWLFLVVAIYYYLVPLFQPRVLSAPFIFALFFAITLPFGFLSALSVGAMFFLILGIKDLILVNREIAYETLFFLLSFLAIFETYQAATSSISFWNWVALILTGALVTFLIRKLPWRESRRKYSFWPAALFGTLVFELGLVLLFLPLDFLYQTAILFLFVIFSAYAMLHLRGGEARARTLVYYFISFTLFAGFILALNTWKI
jgi:hypothetical protein